MNSMMMSLMPSTNQMVTSSPIRAPRTEEGSTAFAQVLSNLHLTETTINSEEKEATNSLTDLMKSFVGMEFDGDILIEDEMNSFIFDALPEEWLEGFKRLLFSLKESNEEQMYIKDFTFGANFFLKRESFEAGKIVDGKVEASKKQNENQELISLADDLEKLDENQELISLAHQLQDIGQEQMVFYGLILTRSMLNEEHLNESKGSLQDFMQRFTTLPGEKEASIDRRLERVFTELRQIISDSQATESDIRSYLTMFVQNKNKDPILSLGPSGERPVSQGILLPQLGVELGQFMSRPQQAAIHLGEHQPREVQQEQLIRQFQQMMQRGALRTNESGMSSFSVKLYPAHLGRLDIQLTQVQGVLVAKLLTSSTAARELVESQLHQLRQAFLQQNLSVERVEVLEQHQTNVRDQDSSKKEQRKQENGSDSNNDDETKEEFKQFLDDLTINEEV